MRWFLASILVVVLWGCSFAPHRGTKVRYLRIEPQVREVRALKGVCLYSVDGVGLLNGRRVIYRKDGYYGRYSGYFWFCSPSCMLRGILEEAFTFSGDCVGKRRLSLSIRDLEPVFDSGKAYALLRVRAVLQGNDLKPLASKEFSYRVTVENGADFEKLKEAFDKEVLRFLDDLYRWLLP